jgi:hypothetical protein
VVWYEYTPRENGRALQFDVAVASGGSYDWGNMRSKVARVLRMASSGSSAVWRAVSVPQIATRLGEATTPGPAAAVSDTSMKVEWDAIGSGMLRKCCGRSAFVRQNACSKHNAIGDAASVDPQAWPMERQRRILEHLLSALDAV